MCGDITKRNNKCSYNSSLCGKESVCVLLLRSPLFLGCVLCVCVRHSLGSFQELGDIGPQIIRSVSSLSLPPFLFCWDYLHENRSGWYSFPFNKAWLFDGCKLGSHIHRGALEKVSSRHVREPALTGPARPRCSAKPYTSLACWKLTPMT